MTSRNLATDRVLVGPSMVSFPKLFQVSRLGRYEIDILYDAGSKVHKRILALEKAAIKNRWGDKEPKGLHKLVQDGDDRVDDSGEVLDGYAGKLYTKAHSKWQPQVTDVENNEVEDPMEVKGGDSCVILVHAFPYDNTKFKNKGVLLTLHGVRKIKDGEALGASPVNATDEMSKYSAAGAEDF